MDGYHKHGSTMVVKTKTEYTLILEKNQNTQIFIMIYTIETVHLTTHWRKHYCSKVLREAGKMWMLHMYISFIHTTRYKAVNSALTYSLNLALYIFYFYSFIKFCMWPELCVFTLHIYCYNTLMLIV